MINAVFSRRSIRKYQNLEVPPELIEKILIAGIAAPSSKNRQPWKFIVVTKSSKQRMLSAMREGLAQEEAQHGLLPNSAQHLKAALYTVQIMEQAPVVVFVINTLGQNFADPLNPEERIYDLCNAQSIGAALENMTLTATALGLGSLWICDIFFAYDALSKWLNTEGEMMAAMTFGYAAETPQPRPRKDLATVVEWRS